MTYNVFGGTLNLAQFNSIPDTSCRCEATDTELMHRMGCLLITPQLSPVHIAILLDDRRSWV